MLLKVCRLDRAARRSARSATRPSRPPQSTLAKFRAEYEYHVREKRLLEAVAKTFAEALAKARGGGRVAPSRR